LEFYYTRLLANKSINVRENKCNLTLITVELEVYYHQIISNASITGNNLKLTATSSMPNFVILKAFKVSIHHLYLILLKK